MVALAGLAEQDAKALPLYAVRPAGLAALLAHLPPPQAAFLTAQDFAAQPGVLRSLPGPDGLAGAVLGLGSDPSPFAFGSLAKALAPGTAWQIEPGDFDQDDAALGFLLGAYAYDRLKTSPKTTAKLAGVISKRVIDITKSVYLTRDLINTPPNLLGPAELAYAALVMAAEYGAKTERVTGAALADRYPALAAVGAGSDRPAEVVVISWTGSQGAAGPRISLCGKGVCFDTGGYDLKPSTAMLKMKKDMGGAAILLGVARAVMALDLPIRLELRLGCVENSISGHAMRPSDVLRTRAGLSVEVGNTDAEGRLVLCDLLAEAAESKPDWLIDAATLTGAARVALGPDLPALFCNNEAMASAILQAGKTAHDPLWQLPLVAGYEPWLDSPVADLNTVSTKPFAGAIIAALFLKRFVPADISWAHIDVYAWNDTTRPGRPEGGEAQTLRAILAAIETKSHQ